MTELVLFELVAVNYCLGGSIIAGVLVSVTLSLILLELVRTANVDLIVLMRGDKIATCICTAVFYKDLLSIFS